MLVARELSEATWPDFERLFTGGGGWDFCGCMVFHRGHHLSRVDYPTRREAGVRNRAEHRDLVTGGRAHGILVYDGDVPVGWCQFGPTAELPGRLPPSAELDPARWRITCLVVARSHRRRGVSRVAVRRSRGVPPHRRPPVRRPRRLRPGVRGRGLHRRRPLRRRRAGRAEIGWPGTKPPATMRGVRTSCGAERISTQDDLGLAAASASGELRG